MRGVLVLGAATAVLVACTSGGNSSGPTSVVPTVTTAPVTVPSSSNTTTLPTTVPTTVAGVLDLDVDLVGSLPAVGGYEVTSAPPGAVDGFAFLVEASALVTEDLGMDRYAVASVRRGGEPVATLLLIGFGTDPPPAPDVEAQFLSSTAYRIGRKIGRVYQPGFSSIEEIKQGSVPGVAWTTWFHDGIGYVTWSASVDQRDGWVDALVLAQHTHAEFTTLADMEGPTPAKFVGLPAGCAWSEPSTDRIGEVLAWGNGWRVLPDFLGQHYGYREFRCEGTGRGGAMTVVDTLAELAEHGFDHEFMSVWRKADKVETRPYRSVLIARFDNDDRAWFQDHYFFVLEPDPSLGADEVDAVVEGIIDANRRPVEPPP